MPPRSLTVAIVAFWLATASWFFTRDLWPRYFASDRPPFTINLEEEARTPALSPVPNNWITHHHGKDVERVGVANSSWDLFIGGQTAGRVYTLVRPSEDGQSFEVYTNHRVDNLHQLLRVIPLADTAQGTATIDSMMRVTGRGELLETTSHASIRLSAPQSFTFEVRVSGKVEDGLFRATGSVKGGPVNLELKGEPVELRSSQGFFDPTRPWSRLYEVEEGRSWRVIYFNPAFDSLMQSVSGMLPGFAQEVQTPVIEGGVKSGGEDFFWNNRETPCHLIEYHGENMLGKTYARKSDGLVLRQEITDQKTDLTIGLTRRPR